MTKNPPTPGDQLTPTLPTPEEDQLTPTLPTAEERPTVTVDEARPFYGLSRGAMFAAVKNGDIPSIRVGRRILLPTAAIRRQLQLDA